MGNDLPSIIREVLGIAYKVLHVRNQYCDLLQTPAHDLSDGVDSKALQSLVKEVPVVHADLLENGVLGPAADGQLERLVDNVDKAGFTHKLLHLPITSDLECPSNLVARVPEELAPLLVQVVGIILDLGVLGQRLDVDLNVLEPSAGLAVAEGLLVQLAPVVDAAVQVTNVNVVEVVLLERPFQLRIIDLERAVWRDNVGLHMRDIGTNHLGRRELVGHVTKG